MQLEVNEQLEIEDPEQGGYVNISHTLAPILKIYKGDGTIFDIKNKGRYHVVKSYGEIQSSMLVDTDSFLLNKCLQFLRNPDLEDKQECSFLVIDQKPHILLRLTKKENIISIFLKLVEKKSS